MSDYLSLSEQNPTFGLACIAPNWAALSDWDEADSQTSPRRCLDRRGFFFVRDQERGKLLLRSLERVLPEMEKNATVPVQQEKVNWLRNLRGRLIQLVEEKDLKRLTKVETLSDKYSHEFHRAKYLAFIKASNTNRKGAGEKPRGSSSLRTILHKHFKIPTPPPLAMVTELINQIKDEQKAAEKKVMERKVRKELEREAKQRKDQTAEKMERRLNKLEGEKAALKAALESKEESKEELAPSPSQFKVDHPQPEPKVIEEVIQTATQAINSLPDPGTNGIPADSFVLGLGHGYMAVEAGATISRTQTAVEILQPGATNPLVIPTPADAEVALNFRSADGELVSEPWALLPGLSVTRLEDGNVLYKFE